MKILHHLHFPWVRKWNILAQLMKFTEAKIRLPNLMLLPVWLFTQESFILSNVSWDLSIIQQIQLTQIAFFVPSPAAAMTRINHSSRGETWEFLHCWHCVDLWGVCQWKTLLSLTRAVKLLPQRWLSCRLRGLQLKQEQQKPYLMYRTSILYSDEICFLRADKTYRSVISDGGDTYFVAGGDRSHMGLGIYLEKYQLRWSKWFSVTAALLTQDWSLITPTSAVKLAT